MARVFGTGDDLARLRAMLLVEVQAVSARSAAERSAPVVEHDRLAPARTAREPVREPIGPTPTDGLTDARLAH
jgi:hypothetical protein